MFASMGIPNFEIIAGTYEEFLLGYKFIANSSEIVQSFASHDHSSSIRSTAISGHYLASGAADDRIVVYDLKARKEHCMLTHHNSTVTCLQFTNNHSHLLSGSSDGVLAVVRVGNWQLEKIWDKAHKGAAILDIAVHSSGKLALTLGADCTLRTWNLVKGRQAYIINLNSKSKDARSLEKITWAEDGVRFILSGGKYTEIWNVESGGIVNLIEHDVRVSSCIWLSKNEILVGYDDGQLAAVKINDCTKNIQKAHAGRIKALAKYEDWIVSGSSTGEIAVWDKELEEVAKHNSGCRITTLGIVALIKVKNEDRDEGAVEETERPTLINLGRSSVVMEVEGSDDESAVCNIKNEAVHFKPVKKKQKIIRDYSKDVKKEDHEELIVRQNSTTENQGRKKKKLISDFSIDGEVTKRRCKITNGNTSRDLNAQELKKEDKKRKKKRKHMLSEQTDISITDSVDEEAMLEEHQPSFKKKRKNRPAEKNREDIQEKSTDKKFVEKTDVKKKKKSKHKLNDADEVFENMNISKTTKYRDSSTFPITTDVAKKKKGKKKKRSV